MEFKSNFHKGKWVNVVEVLVQCGGNKRKIYFHPQSERLERFKKNMRGKIVSAIDTRIQKGVGVWIN